MGDTEASGISGVVSGDGGEPSIIISEPMDSVWSVYSGVKDA